jgi:hypothetical protein
MRTYGWLPGVLALTIAACSSGQRGSGDGDDGFSPLSLEPPPVYALLGYRADLDLTSEQVAALDSIAESAREESAPLLRELEERTGGGQRRAMTRIDPEDEPLVAEIRESQLRVSESVANVLTEEQRGIVCRLYERTRPTMGERGRPSPPSDSADSASVRAGGALAIWHWCRPAVEEESA